MEKLCKSLCRNEGFYDKNINYNHFVAWQEAKCYQVSELLWLLVKEDSV